MTEPAETTATPPEADSPATSMGDPHLDPLADDPEADVEPAPDLAEEYAEAVPIDPTPEQVEQYLELAGSPEALHPAADPSEAGRDQEGS